MLFRHFFFKLTRNTEDKGLWLKRDRQHQRYIKVSKLAGATQLACFLVEFEK